MPRTRTADIAPRRQARQERSREKVERILNATLKMLSEGPADVLSTNAIAARAGVSIGTLYQFFPNKQTIIYELFRDWLSRTLAALDAVQAELAEDAPPEVCIDAILDALSMPHLNTPGHWQLRRAMASSPELTALELQHRQDIFVRIAAFQARFGAGPPEEIAREVMMLQHEVTMACLYNLSLVAGTPKNAAIRMLCRKLLGLLFDYPSWSGLDLRG